MQRYKCLAPLALCSTIALGLAGCGTNPFAASPLSPAPSTPVARETLPPPPSPPVQETQTAEATPAGEETVSEDGQEAAPAPQVAAFAPAEADKMSGGWTVTDSAGSCSLFMSTTAWTGGFRAVTRGCPSEALQSVNAWNVVDGKIALKDSAGTEIARLTRTGETKFDGSFSRGGAVSFSR